MPSNISAPSHCSCRIISCTDTASGFHVRKGKLFLPGFRTSGGKPSEQSWAERSHLLTGQHRPRYPRRSLTYLGLPNSDIRRRSVLVPSCGRNHTVSSPQCCLQSRAMCGVQISKCVSLRTEITRATFPVVKGKSRFGHWMTKGALTVMS